MTEKNAVPNLEAKASDGNANSHQDNGWNDSGNLQNGKIK